LIHLPVFFCFQSDDSATVTVVPTSGIVTSEEGDTAVINVVLDSMPSVDITIYTSSSNPAEGTMSSTSLVFSPTSWNISQAMTVTGVDDVALDGDASFAIITSVVDSDDTNYHAMAVDDVDATNIDGSPRLSFCVCFCGVLALACSRTQIIIRVLLQMTRPRRL
jgi:hypothetical protein